MTGSLTITQGLREVKTLHERIAKKRQFINEHLVRQADRRDPLENDGGQAVVIAREIQAIADMEIRVLKLRRQIAIANLQTQVTVGDETMSISDWIIWKREIAPREREHLHSMAQRLNSAMVEARRGGLAVVAHGEPTLTNLDVIFNFSVSALQEAADKLTRDLGELDGLLSMANATTLIDVPPSGD
jgi:hypothetical protein